METKPDPVNALMELERASKLKLEAAQRVYEEESLAIREKLGSILRETRESAGISRIRMGAIIGVRSPGSSLFYAEHPRTSGKPFSVEKTLEYLTAYRAAVRGVSGISVKSGKVKKKHETISQP